MTADNTHSVGLRPPCVCGRPSTMCVVVHWKTKDRHYDYCELHGKLVLEMDGVDALVTRHVEAQADRMTDIVGGERAKA